MKITVINGNMHHGSTWHCKELIIQALSELTEIQKTEFFLPGDLPEFCCSCFSCFLNGEGTCPHASYVTPFVQAITDVDLVILASPVYGLDVSGQMKALIDHLCFMWMPHRPNPKMFDKIGLTIATTAGAGLNHTTKTMRNSFTYWGVKKAFSFKKAVAALKWADVSAEKQANIRAESRKLAKKIVNSVKNVNRLPNPPFRSLLFKILSGAMKKEGWNPTDRKHWEEQGWLSGVKPF